MKKMQDYIVRGKDVFIGLEDSKRTWKISVRSEKMEIHYTSMPAEYSVLHSYLKRSYPSCKVMIIYEAGFKGFGLHDRLVEDGYLCVVTPPNKVTQEKDNRVKTDKNDCKRLAKVLENGDYKSCHVPDRERREDRQISRTLSALQREITRIKNQIRRMFEFHDIESPFPAGRWSATEYRKLEEMHIDGSVGKMFELYKMMLRMFLEKKNELLKELKLLSKKAKYAETVKILESAPGIGPQTAIRLALEWGERFALRFKTGKEFGSFTGLTCSEYSTGETVRRGRITNQGNRFVRSWLIECAWVAYKRDPVLLSKFQTVYGHSGSKKKAIVAVARKLAVRLWRCVGLGQTYQVGLIEG